MAGQARNHADLETLARECAALDARACEAAIAEHAMVAIRERRIDDAVFWQRVKFRSRMLRAMARGKSEGEENGTVDLEEARDARRHWA